MKRSVLKNRIKSFFGKHKTTIFVVALSLQLAIGLTIYFFFGRISPNDEIFVPKEESVAFLMNENPRFSVEFGKIQEPDKQWVRFEAQTSNKNPFEEERRNIFTKIAELFQKKERYGIEMSLVGVDLNGENLKKYGDEVIQVADVIGTDSVKTSTELVDSGREIGAYEDQETPVSKQTVLNKEVTDGVDLEYQILKGLGLKEEIIIRDLEAYKSNCKEKECLLPVNEFVFDLKMDSDVQLREGWFTIEGQSTSAYYFVDSKGRYIAHFLPNFAIDNVNNKTFNVKLNVEKGEDNNYRAKVTVNLEWLLSSERVFPVRIDPSIVHDDTADFSGGIFNRTESVTGPKVQIPPSTSVLDCTGGTVTTDGDYRIHTFTASGTLVCTGSGNAAVLVVAGGGGGGYWGNGGGGGAGGMVEHSNMSLSTNTYTVTIGNGGAGSGTSAGGRGTVGQDSVFNGITANGGGGGGGFLNNTTSQTPTAGGSGGGGASGQVGAVATQGNSGGGTGYGYAGGDGKAGGGGGAGGAGGVGTCGIGRQSSITGIATYYSGGGGGYLKNGCLGGGGNSGVAGTENTGGGGGSSAAGGSGVVIIRYKVSINISGEYTSSSMDMGSSMSEATLSWTPSGVNTGNGETPYSTTDMVAQWNLNETSGTTAASGGTCGASCNGTLTNMTTSGQDAAVRTGWTADNKRWGAGALMFDGSNDYVTTASLGFDYNTMSIAAWVNPDILTSRRTIIDLGTETTLVPQLEIGACNGGVNAVCVITPGVWQAQTVNNVISTGVWNYIVYTKSGAGATHKIYVNGVEQTLTLNASATYASTSASKKVGSRAGSTQFFSGTLDALSLYSRALSADEILSNYQAGNIEFQYRVSADNSTWSSWTSYGTSASDLAWESFDNPYLYETDTSGLIGYWPMDEASGTGAYILDKRGTNNGTPTGTTFVGGKSAGARSFNGSSNYIDIANSAAYNVSNLTIEAWVYSVNFNQNGFIFEKGSVNTQYSLFFEGANMVFRTYNTAATRDNLTFATSTYFNNRAWNHVACTYDGSNKKVYVNGVLAASKAYTQTLSTGQAGERIGAYGGATPAYFFSGIIDEVRVFNTALSAATIVSDYTKGIMNKSSVVSQNPGSIKMEGAGSTQLTSGSGVVDSNTVALWHLDERGGSGAYLKDSSASGLHVTPTGTAYTNIGKIGGARTFSGSGHYIPISSGFSQITTLTISLWFNTSSTSRQMLVGQSNAAPTGAPTSFVPTILIQADGKIRAEYWTGAGGAITTSSAYNDGVWHHVEFVGSGTSQQLFVDGVSIGTRAGTIVHSWWTVSTIGVGYDSTDRGGASSAWVYFNGKIDEVRVSNIARTADEAANAYRLGRDTYVNKAVDVRDLSSLTTLPIYIAGDRPGSFLNTIWGETGYSNYQPDANTVGLWHLDEASGTGEYLLDSSGMSNHGTPTGTTYTASGRVGSARSFNGTSDYVSVTSVAGLSTGNTVHSIEMWTKPTAIPTTRQWPLLLGGATTGNFHLLYNTTGTMSLGAWSGGQCLITPIVGAWNHVVFTFDGTTGKCYLDGVLKSTAAATFNFSSTALKIAQAQGGEAYFSGGIDEIRISNIARTPDEIRQSYEVGLRTHPVQIDFGASLVSGNLITGSGDTSFSIDATVYGLADLGSGIYKDEKIIVKENYDGTEYIAQGTVSTITETTGAVTVSSWDSGSTFPSAGYTVNADVFKWQKEYIPIKNRTVGTHVDAVNLLTFRITNGDQGRNIWIDDLRSSSGYLSAYTGEELTFPSSGRYFQYKAIFSTWDIAVTPYISQVQLDYFSGPTLDLLMRHGKWFNSSGVKQPFWWVGTH